MPPNEYICDFYWYGLLYFKEILSIYASDHGNHFKASGQVSFKHLFTLLSNKGHHILSNFWICCCMRNKLFHTMVIFVMFKWYKLLHFKEIIPIYWMTLVYYIKNTHGHFKECQLGSRSGPTPCHT